MSRAPYVRASTAGRYHAQGKKTMVTWMYHPNATLGRLAAVATSKAYYLLRSNRLMQSMQRG